MPSLTRRKFLSIALAGALTATSVVSARASEELVRLERIGVHATADGGYVLNGHYVLNLTPMLAEALLKGVSFAFIQAFEAERPRDYWFAQQIAVVHRHLLLSYNALLRQYQLQIGQAHQNFDTLSEALDALGDISGWPVLSKGQIQKGATYQVRVRMYFDPSKLSKPLQLNAFASERWDMDSGWFSWPFKP